MLGVVASGVNSIRYPIYMDDPSHPFIGKHVEDEMLCVVCDKRLGDTMDHFPDILVDEGHASTCSVFCSEDDCEEEHPCGGLSHYAGHGEEF